MEQLKTKVQAHEEELDRLITKEQRTRLIETLRQIAAGISSSESFVGLPLMDAGSDEIEQIDAPSKPCKGLPSVSTMSKWLYVPPTTQSVSHCPRMAHGSCIVLRLATKFRRFLRPHSQQKRRCNAPDLVQRAQSMLDIVINVDGSAPRSMSQAGPDHKCR